MSGGLWMAMAAAREKKSETRGTEGNGDETGRKQLCVSVGGCRRCFGLHLKPKKPAAWRHGRTSTVRNDVSRH